MKLSAKLSLSLLSLWVALSVSTARAEVLRGSSGNTVGTGANRTIQFRTATENLMIRLDGLPVDVMSRLVGIEGHTRIVNVDIPAANIVSRSAQPYGVRADCSELPLSFNDLEQVAQSPGVTDINSFLQNIPPGTLQGFTFITNSQSAQRGEGAGTVSSQWPRVLRTSRDGKLTLSYVCNPASGAYDQVEVMYFDDATQSFKTASFNFRGTTAGSTGRNQRVERDPPSCAGCHSDSRFNGTPSIHPNWPEYFQWNDCQRTRGISMYGGNDDNMDPRTNSSGQNVTFRNRLHSSSRHVPNGCTNASDRAAHRDEIADFQQFRQTQRDNPCYSSLPWAQIPAGQESTSDYRFYPYAVVAQQTDSDGQFNYSLRTNTRFTDMYSHLMAQRIQRLMRDLGGDNYERIKYYLAMEGASCLTPADYPEIERAVPGFRIRRDTDSSVTAATSYMSPLNQAPVTYSFSQFVGMRPGDWSMEYNRPDDPNYNAVIFAGSSRPNSTGTRPTGGDWAISDVVQGEVIEEISRTDSAVAARMPGLMSQGITEKFGQRFRCIDELGSAVRGGARGPGQPICNTLRAQNTQHQARLRARDRAVAQAGGPNSCPADPSPAVQAQQIQDAADRAEADPASIARGRALVNNPTSGGQCIRCHGPSGTMRTPDYQFIPGANANTAPYRANLARFRSRMREDGFPNYLRDRINDQEMPPEGAGNLSAQDRQDMINYLESLAN